MNIFRYLKTMRIVKKVTSDENLLSNLSQLFGFNFKIDNIGRIYSVINPLIKRGVYDQASQVYGYDEQLGRNNREYIEHWVWDRMEIAENFIINTDMFNILQYEITKLDDKENYLLIFKPFGYDEFKHSLKLVGGIFLGISLISLIIFLFI